MADIYVNYGKRLQEMTIRLLEAADIGDSLNRDARVCIKPNLVVSRAAAEGATTHPEIVEGIIQYLLDRGIRHITVAEGAWVGDSTRRAFSRCGYERLAEAYGVRLLDTKDDRTRTVSVAGYSMKICESILDTDYLINVPVMKGHCQTGMTCCLKNLKGCIPDSEKRRFHTQGLHRPIAALNTVLRPQLHIVDGICGDLTFEEGGNPVVADRLLLGFDPVLLDSFCAGLMGFAAEEIHHLQLARQMGVGSFAGDTTQIVALGGDCKPPKEAVPSTMAQKYAAYIDEDGACSACYAALIFALNKGVLPKKGTVLRIGQGFQGKRCGGIGVGNCTSGCDRFVKGCPPVAKDIVAFLKQMQS